MKRILFVFSLCLCASLANLHAQGIDQSKGGFTEGATVSIGRARPATDGGAGLGTWGGDPFHVQARHWPQGCDAARQAYIDAGSPADWLAMGGCGEVFEDEWGHNLITSAGEDALSDIIGKVSSPPAQFNYVALTNTGITPAKGDTTLSGEIGSNGLQRAQGTHTNTSAAIGTPPTAGSLATVGTSGAATLDYWVFACTYQGCTAVGTAAQITTANATLTNANYVTGSFTGKLGAAYYVIVRTNSGSTPSGAQAGGTAQTSPGTICTGQAGTNCAAGVGWLSCGALTAGTAPTCKFGDQSNNTEAFTVPASDQTYAGSHTLAKTFTATGTQSAQAFGIFNASSVGTMLAEGTFTSASLVTNDTLAFTWTMYH